MPTLRGSVVGPIRRRCRPRPGSTSPRINPNKLNTRVPLDLTDTGHRVTAFITDTGHRVIPGQLAGLELRHRQHARVEDRIRQAKAMGLRNFPCPDFQANTAWLEIVMTATDLVA